MAKYFHSLIFILSLFIIVSCSTESTPVYTLGTFVTPEEGGAVIPESGEYDEGTSVEITANQNEGWVFKGWQGQHSGSQNPDTIVMNSDKEISALFEKREYPLTIHKEGEGSVSERVVQAKTTEYPHGSVVELTAESAEGWDFDGWSGDVESTEQVIEVTIEGETNITVTFERLDYPLTITIEGEGEVEQEIISSPKTTEYPFETVVELTANPMEGWEFIEWAGDLSGNENPQTVEIDEEKSISAVFEVRTLSIEIEINGGGRVELTPDKQVYEFEEAVELRAVPDDGWVFSNWSGDLSGSENPKNITMNNNLFIIANFERAPNTFRMSMPQEGSITLFEANNAMEEVSYVSTEEIAFGDGNDGIWRTSDTGQTWEKTAEINVNFISVASNEPDLVVAGHDEGYLLSNDGGRTWNSGEINDPFFGNPLSLFDGSTVSASDGIYIATRDALGAGLFRSTNAGQSWQHILTTDDVSENSDALLQHVETSPDNENVIYTSTSFDDNIWRSTNGGGSFSSIKNGITISPFVFSDGIRVNPSNANELLISGHISDDSGDTWVQENVSPQSNIWVSNVLLKIEGNEIMGSNDLGASWSPVIDLIGDNIPSIHSPTIIKSQNSIYMKVDESEIYRIDLSLVKKNI